MNYEERCGLLHLLGQVSSNAVVDLVFDTRSQTTGQLNGSRIVLLAARDGATLHSKLVHTSVTEQQAAYAAATPVTGTKPEAIHSIALFA